MNKWMDDAREMTGIYIWEAGNYMLDCAKFFQYVHHPIYTVEKQFNKDCLTNEV